MPIDLRSGLPAPQPTARDTDKAPAELDRHDPSADDDDYEDQYDEHGGEINPTPERLAEIEAAWIAEDMEAIKAIDDGRETLIPWEEARELIFAPPTPEELAALPPRRARRR